MPYFLLAMQAAGMITDFFGTQYQTNLMNMGMKIQQAGLEANLYQTKLETENASVQAMIKLRQTLGTQIAMMAARGTSTSAGSAVSLLTESIGNFNADEKIRRLNLLGRENQLRGNSLISSLQNSSDTAKLWQSFASRTFNRFPSSFPGGQRSGNEGFGLSSIGGG